jgi:hypothetical protein
MRTALAVFALAAVPFCRAAAPAADRTAQWTEDLQVFATQFPASHIDFDKLWDRAAFDAEISALRRDAATLSDAEITLRLMKLAGAGHVAHTYVGAPASGPLHRLPLSLNWYPDGLAITGADAAHAAAIGTRVLRIGTMAPDDVLTAAAPYIPHENQSGLRAGAANYLTLVELLRLVHAAPAEGPVEFTVAKPGGSSFTVAFAPAEPGSGPIQGMYDALHLPTPLFRKNPRRYYWYEYLADSKSLYLQYASCQNDPSQPFADFVRDFFAFADAHPVDRVIVDLRSNGGGNSMVMRPLTAGLESRRKLRSRVLVLIGPETFSSAVLNAYDLQHELHARLLGEPTGEKPNSYGEVRSFQLPNSHLRVQYSVKFFRLLEDRDPAAFEPDIRVGRTLEDALAGRDPVLDAALRVKP